MRILNKKAIMVDFLVTILLAIIIFAPACYVSSTYFRLSDQSKQNFMNFVDTVKEVEKTTDSHKTALLILDEGTAIIYFEPAQTKVTVSAVGSGIYADNSHTLILVKPSACVPDKGCLCLFRDPDYEVSSGLFKDDTITITEERPYCQDFELPLKVDTCSIGQPTKIDSYTCINGFMIGRHLASGTSTTAKVSYFEVARRTQISLSNQGDIILFSKNEQTSQ